MPNYKKRIEKWIAALEDPPLPQCSNTWYLVDDSGKIAFCCANYLAFESLPLKIRNQWEAEHRGVEEMFMEYLNLDKDTLEDLYILNDDKGKAFKQIAKYIEKNILPKAATK